VITFESANPSQDAVPTITAAPITPLARVRQLAWLAIVIADAGLLLWGALTLIAPQCPGACMTSGFESFTGQSWADLAAASVSTASFLLLLFRVFGAYNVAFGFLGIAVAATAFRRGEAWAWWALLVANTLAYGSAMTYDRMVGFIGTNEMLEYVCIAGVYAAAAVTAPMQALHRSARKHSTGGHSVSPGQRTAGERHASDDLQ
jgi:hypothetical protein